MYTDIALKQPTTESSSSSSSSVKDIITNDILKLTEAASIEDLETKGIYIHTYIYIHFKIL